jgi:transposase
VLAAVCPATGDAVGMLSPHINVEVMNVFLERFAATLADDVHAVMIWDQAGFHTGHDLVVPENITLVPLPPYSPELNPVENLWHYLRSHYWANRAFADYAALEAAAMTAWQQAAAIPELVQSVCHVSYTTAR